MHTILVIEFQIQIFKILNEIFEVQIKITVENYILNMISLYCFK